MAVALAVAVTFIYPLQGKAANSGPGIYNGNSQYTNMQSLPNQPNQQYTSWLSLNGADSNYVGAKHNQTDQKTSVLDLDQYKSNPSTLYQNVLVKNTSSTTMTIHLGFLLPESHPDASYKYKGVTEKLPQITYSGSDASSMQPDSSVGTITQKYRAEGDYHWFNTLPDWSKMDSVRIDGSLAAGQTYKFRIPLKLVNVNTIDVDYPGNYFQFYTKRYTDTSNAGDIPVYGKARFAERVPIDSYLGTGKHYLATYIGKDGNTVKAPELQDLMPTIQLQNTNGTVIEFDNNNSEFGGEDLTTTDAYTGSLFYIDYTKLKSADGTMPWLTAIQKRGYTVVARNNQVPYAQFPYSISPRDNDDPVNNWVDQGNIGNAVLTAVKVIDANDITLHVGDKWNPMDHVTIWNPYNNRHETPTKVNNPVVRVSGTVDTSRTGVYPVTYSYDVPYNKLEPNGQTPYDRTDTITRTINVTVIGYGNHGGNSNNGGSSTPNNNNNGNNAWNPTKPNGKNGTGLPNYAAVKGSAVYATKTIYMYKNPTFNKSHRIAKYPKSKRINRPMFVVTGYARSNGGALRYKVRDVNHSRKTDGKIGYITANRKFVVNVYYKTMPKNMKITVISKKGVHAYKHANLTGRVTHYKTGKHLRVKKLVKHNLTTRYVLSNGYYVTANKKLVIHGNY
ncbi:hypothetical protein FD17_GL002063 [Lentilactobacillus sunkii DSM 19904]|uniref:DUF5776 domain-containing protein n=2 Tax=Lentilactobacillus sunkii TaxID=481719 RepID=A0A0R1L0Q0_9LACO|nr:hypothetical protein FD17_GL002063 [Lentilactobacillus sunkii DSM 19904]